MPSQSQEAHIEDVKRNLHNVEGGERLQLWMELTRLQNEESDNQVSAPRTLCSIIIPIHRLTLRKGMDDELYSFSWNTLMVSR